MKKNCIAITTGILVLLLTSCSPELSVAVNSDMSCRLSFKTSFSDAMATTVRTITGAENSGAPLFTPDEIVSAFKNAGMQQVRAATPDRNSLSVAGTYTADTAGMIVRQEHSCSLVIGPEQFQKLYASLNQEGQGYLDLLMAPVFTGEKMSVSEYQNLLSSVYGPAFATELTSGTITLSLTAPDKIHTVQKKITLAELLTLTENKTLTVTW